MPSRRRTSVKETWNPAPDLQGDELRELIDLVRFLAQRGDIATLSGEDTREHNRFQQVNVNYFSEFVVRDAKTGFFIKGVDADIASVEYDTMNYLHGVLEPQQMGVQAIRHAFMVGSDNSSLPTINIIEPAQGRMLSAIHPNERTDEKGRLVHVGYGPPYRQALETARDRLDKALTQQVRQLITSDLNGNNILLDDNDTYTIIDQPHPTYSRVALRWLRHNK